MPLRCPRFSGDRVLEACLAGGHRMLAPEDGLQVARVQEALIRLGYDVGPKGVDGYFGSATGTAVSAFKRVHGLSPSDPVVGTGTMGRLDGLLFHDPPHADPDFGEFPSWVADHRVESLVALLLSSWRLAPFDSWRWSMAGFALEVLSSGALLGIVAQSRAWDLRRPFIDIADAIQPDGTPSVDYFDNETQPGGAASTVVFQAGADVRAFMLLDDSVVLGRARVFRHTDGRSAASPLDAVLVHELTHVRNREQADVLAASADDDPDVFADPLSAAAATALTDVPSGREAEEYVAELMAVHLEWIITQEARGTPGAIAVRLLQADAMAAGALYFLEQVISWRRNGYGDAINLGPREVRFRQAALWLRLASNQLFSSDQAQDAASTQVFRDAAGILDGLASDPSPGLPAPDGVSPLPWDFT